MLSIGGAIDNDGRLTDPWINGLGVFGMTDLKWKFEYAADAEAYALQR